MDNGLLLGTHSGSFCGFSKFYEMSTAKWNQIILWHVKIIPLFPSFWLQARIFFFPHYGNQFCWNYLRLLPKLFWFTMRKNCSSDRVKCLKFEAEGWEFAKTFEITSTIYFNSERPVQFLKQNASGGFSDLIH